MSEQRDPTVWLEVWVSLSLERQLGEIVARKLSYPSIEAVYFSDDGDDALVDPKVRDAVKEVVVEALRQWLAGKATSGSSAPSSPAGS